MVYRAHDLSISIRLEAWACTSNREEFSAQRNTTFAISLTVPTTASSPPCRRGGVTGGMFNPVTMLVLGVVNLPADGLSMGVGTTWASVRMNECGKRGAATFVAFVMAGAVPLVPYAFLSPLIASPCQRF